VSPLLERVRLCASIVLYGTPPNELQKVLSCFSGSPLKIHVDLIDNYGRIDYGPIIKKVGVTYFQTGQNLGYGKAHNISILRSINSSDYHLVLNPDISFSVEILSAIIRFMDQNKDVGMIMPRVLSPEGKLQHLCKLLPTPLDLFVRRFIPFSMVREWFNRNYELQSFGYNCLMDVPSLSGCFMFLRTAAVQDVGGFDEKFFMYAEDIDLTRRIHAKYKTLFFPYVSVTHVHAQESYKSKRMLLVHVRNIVRYFNKWGWFFDLERKKINALARKSAKFVIKMGRRSEFVVDGAVEHMLFNRKGIK